MPDNAIQSAAAEVWQAKIKYSILPFCRKFTEREDLDELLQEAFIGFFEAYKKDPEDGAKHYQGAKYAVLNFMTGRDRDRSAATGNGLYYTTWKRVEMYQYRRAADRIRTESRAEPTPEAVAVALKWTIKRARTVAQELNRACVHLDKDVRGKDGGIDCTLADTIPALDDQIERLEAAVDRDIAKADIRAAMQRLRPRERDIITALFLDPANDNKTGIEIAEGLGVSRQRVDQLKKSALLKLKKALKTYYQDKAEAEAYKTGLQRFRDKGYSSTELAAEILLKGESLK